MIYIADNERDLYSEILLLSRSDPFGCRIVALYNTYDYRLPFVDFWVQFINGEAVSALARLESVFILRLTDRSDIEEISAFVRASAAVTVLCDGKYSLDYGLCRAEGPVLVNKNSYNINAGFKVFEPTAKELYSIISECVSENFRVPPYESFMLDVNHRLKKNTIRMYAIKKDLPAACVMTVAESEDSAVLGAVAALPEYRRSGMGSFLVKYISNELIEEGKRVFVHRAADANIEFYSKLGFTQYGLWAEYE